MGGTGGGKLRKTVVQDGELTLMKDYTSGYVYRNAELDYFKSENGRIRKTASGYTPEYHLTDHLGNVRVAFEPNGSGGLDAHAGTALLSLWHGTAGTLLRRRRG
jgi:hypothetical protein